jgi:transposase
MDTERPFFHTVWEQIPAAVQDDSDALEARLAALEAPVRRLEATVEHLTERRQQDARTSSRPPSRAPPQALGKRPRRAPRGRRPGGQPGHEGQTRMLRPGGEVTVLISVKPERCRRGQDPRQGEAPPPQRHQGPAIPPIKPVITAEPRPRLVCPAGGDATRAEVPIGVPRGDFGPRVPAITTLCTGAYRVSKRTTPSVRADLFGVSGSLGTGAPLAQATVPALAAPVAAARASGQAPPAASLAEPGGRAGQPQA